VIRLAEFALLQEVFDTLMRGELPRSEQDCLLQAGAWRAKGLNAFATFHRILI
jgi:hypothetical protein